MIIVNLNCGRTLFVPGHEIGPSTTLVYEVKLVNVREVDASEESLNFENLDYDKDGVLNRDEVRRHTNYERHN